MTFNRTTVRFLAAGFFLVGSTVQTAGAQDAKTEKEDQVSAEAAAAVHHPGGGGMGMAMAADKHGYPGPRHVLEMKEELKLTDQQVSTAKEVMSEVHTKSREINDAIAEREEQLESLFAAGGVNDARVQEEVMAIAQMKGKLRLVHLRAHMRMAEALTKQQIEAYLSARASEEGAKAMPADAEHGGGAMEH